MIVSWCGSKESVIDNMVGLQGEVMQRKDTKQSEVRVQSKVKVQSDMSV